MIEAFITGPPHTKTIVIPVQIEPRLVVEDDLVPFRCSSIPSSVASLQKEVSGGGYHWQHTCSSARRLLMLRQDTDDRSEGVADVWIAANKAIRSIHTYRIM
ncbi:hypothetical protein TNCV_520191 [Trichonephila clavipes]|nr:hypothetical protein TNCV_520191 [Trichonephila clavipes]